MIICLLHKDFPIDYSRNICIIGQSARPQPPLDLFASLLSKFATTVYIVLATNCSTGCIHKEIVE